MIKFKNKEFSKYFFNTSWVMFDKVLRILSGLLLGAWVARYLGPDKLGALSYSQSYVFLFTAIASLGLDNIIIRELVNKKYPASIILGTSILLRMASSVVIILIIYSSLQFQILSDDVKIMIMIISCSVFIQSFNIIDLYFQSIVKSKIISIISMISLIISIIIKVYFIITNKGVLYFSFMFLLEASVTSILMVVFYCRRARTPARWGFNYVFAKKILSESWPLILSSVSIALAMRLDQVMIMKFLGAGDVGLYSVGVKLAESMTFIPSAILASVFPKIIEKKFSVNIDFHRKLFQYPLYLLILFSLLVTLLSPFIVKILFGDTYSDSSIVLAILTWSVPLSYIGGYINKLMVVENLTKFVLYRQVSLLLINIMLNILFIPRLGIIGAAISTLIADIIVNLFFHFIFSSTRKFKSLFKVF